jgi:hypothetical protein
MEKVKQFFKYIDIFAPSAGSKITFKGSSHIETNCGGCCGLFMVSIIFWYSAVVLHNLADEAMFAQSSIY